MKHEIKLILITSVKKRKIIFVSVLKFKVPSVKELTDFKMTIPINAKILKNVMIEDLSPKQNKMDKMLENTVTKLKNKYKIKDEFISEVSSR